MVGSVKTECSQVSAAHTGGLRELTFRYFSDAKHILQTIDGNQYTRLHCRSCGKSPDSTEKLLNFVSYWVRRNFVKLNNSSFFSSFFLCVKNILFVRTLFAFRSDQSQVVTRTEQRLCLCVFINHTVHVSVQTLTFNSTPCCLLLCRTSSCRLSLQPRWRRTLWASRRWRCRRRPARSRRWRASRTRRRTITWTSEPVRPETSCARSNWTRPGLLSQQGLALPNPCTCLKEN